MRSDILSCLAVLTIASLGLPGSFGAADDCVVLDLPEVPAAHAAELRRSPLPPSGWWVEVGEELLVCGDLVAEVRTDRLLRRHDGVDPARLAVARGFDVRTLEASGHRILAAAHGFMLVETAPEWRWAAAAEPGARADHGSPRILPVEPGDVVLRRSDLSPFARRQTSFSPETAAVAAAVDPARWYADVVTLAGWDRHTTRIGSEIDQARDWLVARFAELGLDVTTPMFYVNGVLAYNVVGALPGAARPDDWVLIGGHYDAWSSSPPSPGAEDNASGCAGVLELARVLTPTAPEATVLFICWSGEEQGLYGSTNHAQALYSNGDDDKVDLILNMDMIGYTWDSELDVLLESEPVLGDAAIPLLEDAAVAFSGPVTYTSWDAGGSDHVPYLQYGMPAVLTIENDCGEYPYYHTSLDLPGNLSQAMGGAILRMNAGAAAHLAGAGDGSIFTDGFESGTLTAWTTILGGP